MVLTQSCMGNNIQDFNKDLNSLNIQEDINDDEDESGKAPAKRCG